MPSKKLTFKLVDAYAIFIALNDTEKVNKSIPFKLAWEIADVKEAFKKHATRMEEERLKVISTYGSPSETGAPGSFNIPVEKTGELNAAIQEINDTEVEIEFTPILLARFENAIDMQFAPGAFETLRKHIIEFPAKKEEKKEEVKTE